MRQASTLDMVEIMIQASTLDFVASPYKTLIINILNDKLEWKFFNFLRKI